MNTSLTATPDERLLDETLDGLGSSASQVADTLRAQGITGRPGQTSSCPVANYLRRRFGDDVVVREDSIRVGATSVVTPSTVYEFVWNFDHEFYPDLEAPEVAAS